MLQVWRFYDLFVSHYFLIAFLLPKRDDLPGLDIFNLLIEVGLFNLAIRLDDVALLVLAVFTLIVDPLLAFAFFIASIDPTFLG